MTWSLLAIQALNGLQYGVLLFLLAAGLTLVLGIMNFVNLAHGSLYMMGAYLGAAVYGSSGSFLFASFASVFGTLAIGVAIERSMLVALYARDHLYQVLATVGLIMFFSRIYLPLLLAQFTEKRLADAAGSALASMLIYLFMAIVLAVRPQGLFPVAR